MNFKLNIKIKMIHYILFLTIILVCLYQQVITYSPLLTPIVEGYQSYENCIEQGYPLDFCLQVPVQAYIG